MPPAVPHPRDRELLAQELAQIGCDDLRERYAAHSDPGKVVRYRWVKRAPERGAAAWGWDDGTVMARTEEIDAMLRNEVPLPSAVQVRLAEHQREAERDRVQRVGAEAKDALERLQRLAAQAAEQGPGEGVRKMREAAERQEAADRARLQAPERLAAAARLAGVPGRIVEILRGEGLLRYDRTWPGCQLVREWERAWRDGALDERGQRRGQALLLCGVPGTGKSTAAAAWLSTLTDQDGRPLGGRFCWTGELALAVQPDEDGKGKALLHGWMRAPALVFDDAKEMPGTAAVEAAERILQAALDNGRRVIATCNGDSSNFFGLFGDGENNRILSRWRRVGGEIREVRA